MRAGISCCNHLFRRQRRPTIARRSTCDATSEAARGPPPLPTTTASVGDLGCYRHLRHEERLTRRGMRCCGHPARRQRRPTVGSPPLVMHRAEAPRRST